MNSLNRISQIKEIQTYYDTREELENSIIDLNISLTKENKEIIEIVEKYVENFISSNDFSIDFIMKLINKLKIYKWINIQTDVSVSKMLFSLIYSTVLLPNYISNDNQEKNYIEFKKLIDSYITHFDQEIDKMQENNFHLEIWNVYELNKEVLDNIQNLGYELEGRMFTIWEWFWNNVFSYNEETWNYSFRIPISLDLKNKKIKRKINIKNLKNTIVKIWSNFSEKFNLSKFSLLVSEEIDIDCIYWDDEEAKYLTIYLSKNQEVNDFHSLVSLLNILINLNNFFINEIAKQYELNIPKKINLFSSWESLFLSPRKSSIDSIDGLEWEGEDKEKDLKQFKISDDKKVTLNDVWWQEKAKKEIETIIKLIKNEQIIKSWGAKTTKWIIFEWPSGTWKTLLARVIASELDAEVYNIKLTDIQSSAYINEWANNIKSLFNFLKKRLKKVDKKIIVILDELDALFIKRSSNSSSSLEDVKIVNTFLAELSWMEELDNIIFIWTTNMIENIDEAVIRSWRMETKVHVWLPNLKDKIEIYKIHINKLSQKAKESFANIDIEEVAKLSDDMTWADIESIINKIITKKAIEEVETWKISYVTIQDLKEAIDVVKWKGKKQPIWFFWNKN